jgi:hypothetical protein
MADADPNGDVLSLDKKGITDTSLQGLNYF